jgi:hypothetical protein
MLRLDRNLEVVERHQAPQRGDDDGAGAGEADLPRNRGVVPDGELAIVEREIVLPL